MAIPADSEKTTDQPPNGGSRELKPMEVDVARIVLIGTGLYAIAAVVLLAMHTSLTRAGHGRWPWVAVSGTVLGLLGLYYVKRRDRAIARDRAAAAAAAGKASDGGSADAA
ncbi:DUF2530 domain-containing protein [Actinospica durhamensis]|uniref:DUF2530 domain-containing protein n=1 Tax=Actinospica durhamensis TaxID=1508375 RepID=A0A941EY18_9ACTN|nr:DUF2530 domain-containing protein [Actinospica durhamensis]MBR7838533.1 DUF2530 domain-containing protein [Actinospica durhamensis]